MQTEFEWPTISEKTDGLELSVVEEDQIFVIEVCLLLVLDFFPQKYFLT